MNFYSINEEYVNAINSGVNSEEEILEKKNDADKLDFLEVKENILSTIARSTTLEELNNNFMLSRQRMDYANSVLGRINTLEEKFIFELSKKLYNFIYNKLNGIS